MRYGGKALVVGFLLLAGGLFGWGSGLILSTCENGNYRPLYNLGENLIFD